MGNLLSTTTQFSEHDCRLPSPAAKGSATPDEIVPAVPTNKVKHSITNTTPAGSGDISPAEPKIQSSSPSESSSQLVTDVPSAITSTKSNYEAHIRILRLHPPPWYFRWFPRSFHYMIPLRGTLSPEKLGDHPRYRALSYTWGLSKATSKILINNTTLLITPSLADALVHLRLRNESLLIWIDQICINQQDKTEKTAQVNIMDLIYRTASEALIWLGPSASNSDNLMDVLIRMGKFAEDFKLLDYYTETRMPELNKIVVEEDPEDAATKKYHAYCDAIMPSFIPRLYESLIALYQRPWFTRVWVLQEFALAPKATFLCGSRTISAEILMVVLQMVLLTMMSKVLTRSPNDYKLAALLERLSALNTIQPFFASRQRRKAQDEGRKQGDGLYEILQKVHVDNGLQATEGGDMVYGLLALASDKEALGITADFEGTENGADVVYTRTARAIIKSGKVDVLIFAQHIKKDIHLLSWVPDWRSELRRSFAREYSKEKVDVMAAACATHFEELGKLPSWVPDWRCEIQRSFAWLREDPSQRKALFSASDGLQLGQKELELINSADRRELPLMGYRVDEVEMVGGPWNGNEHDETTGRFPHERYTNYLSQVRQMCQLSKAKGADIYKSEERRVEAEWRIPVGDIEQDGTAMALRATTSWKLAYEKCCAELELQMQWKALGSLEEYKARQKEVDEMDGRSSEYRIRMQEMRGKRPFLSKFGYVGMGPSCMCPRDVIVIFVGATLPFVVRPLGKDRFRLLGECYCDGIMNGEIVKLRLRKQEKITLI